MLRPSAMEDVMERLYETELAIIEQRRTVDRQTDPLVKATAARTLATLEDMLLIMQRTQGLVVAHGYLAGRSA